MPVIIIFAMGLCALGTLCVLYLDSQYLREIDKINEEMERAFPKNKSSFENRDKSEEGIKNVT